MTMLKFILVSIFGLSLMGTVFAQSDPGPRGGAPGAGGPLDSVNKDKCIDRPPGNGALSCDILDFFNDAQGRFTEIDSVFGTNSEMGVGLGPRFNSRGCAFCHAQPAVGGTSPATNPQVADATIDGARNTVPSFITSTGPVREARFPFFFNANGQPDTTRPNGGVEDLYTITGRSDAGTCSLSQPSFAQAVATNNVIFRIPTPLFGAGLIENIDDTTLLNNKAAQGNNVGISGTFNRNGNDGTITRFGWKAQNKSLVIFSGEAYNVEMGVSNEVFTQERPLPGEGQAAGLPANCKINPTPEDHTNFTNGTALGTSSDLIGFAIFMRFLAPPTPAPTTTSITNGSNLFNSIGCAVCHTLSLSTRASSLTTG